MRIDRRITLERLRSWGIRLVAGDEEALFDFEQDDHVYCESCGQFFALRSDEAQYQEEARVRHMTSDEHRNRWRTE